MASDTPSETGGATASARRLEGRAASEGVRVGPLWLLESPPVARLERTIRPQDVALELERYAGAVEQASEKLTVVRKQAASRGARAELSILDAYLLMLKDSVLESEVATRIRAQAKCLEWAIEDATDGLARQLESTPDPYLRERGHDIRFVATLLLEALPGKERRHARALQPPPHPCVLVAQELSPAEAAELAPEQILAIVTEAGTRTSHVAILARALGIPAVVGCSGALAAARGHSLAVVDGTRGWVVFSPDHQALHLADSVAPETPGQEALVPSPCLTLDKVPFELAANIEFPFEVGAALRAGAAGIGLYRTEFLLSRGTAFPSEEEQFRVYRDVVQSTGGRPVTFRTFDIGGDKFGGVVSMPRQSNPALGLRALRLSLAQPAQLRIQFRALLRAAAFGAMRIMVPMVTTVAEMRAARSLFEAARDELVSEGNTPDAAHAAVPLGCMLEVPAAALTADHLATVADFFSVGTNDLVQYTMAADRGSSEVAHLASPLDPAVLRLLKLIAEAATASKTPVSVCGASASDPAMAVLLLGLGFDSLSVEAQALGRVRKALRAVSSAEARALAAEALSLSSAEAVESRLQHRGRLSSGRPADD